MSDKDAVPNASASADGARLLGSARGAVGFRGDAPDGWMDGSTGRLSAPHYLADAQTGRRSRSNRLQISLALSPSLVPSWLYALARAQQVSSLQRPLCVSSLLLPLLTFIITSRELFVACP